MSELPKKVDVLVIGAGPGGSAAGTVLADAGRSVLCLERGHFPRFVIGESLLPRCNQLLDEIGMLDAVRARGYQRKPGAVFRRGDEVERFEFAEGLEGDYPDTFQVPRDDFDQVLATTAQERGVDIRFGHQVDAVDFRDDGATVTFRDLESDTQHSVEAEFVLDCSGYGRVLPRLLDLERPADLPPRTAMFTQMEGDERPEGDLGGDIWITCHENGGWFWVIPFSDGRTSVGFVGEPEALEAVAHLETDEEKLRALLDGEPNAGGRLKNARPVRPVRTMTGWSTKVKALYGDRWALVGNAADFLDPIFSSGVTLTLESAVLSARLVDRQLAGERPDWQSEYTEVINRAVNVFREFVFSWYRGDLPNIFFSNPKPLGIKWRICSILGGNVLRQDNKLCVNPERNLSLVVDAVKLRRENAEPEASATA